MVKVHDAGGTIVKGGVGLITAGQDATDHSLKREELLATA